MNSSDTVSSFAKYILPILAAFLHVNGVVGDETHWSFVTPQRPELPVLSNEGWTRNAIDSFVLARIDDNHLVVSPEESKRRLIRRLYLDLTGLPPRYDEVVAFEADASPNAYERLVDRLLASPRYGERWAQHWLDVVRYADSDGFEYDDERPGAWRYRDWVIQAWNDDLPFDQFVRDQLCGDLLYPDEVMKHVPTGLHRLGPLRKNAGNQNEERNRQELLVEMTDAIGTSFLGLTIGCAKCHDHKFDAISQAEYYSLQAFFAATLPVDIDAEGNRVNPKESTDHDFVIMSVVEQESVPPTFVLTRGVAGQHEKQVSAELPESLQLATDAQHANRMQLADWLVSRRHPLTARVIVNRLWQHHFGRGIVATPNDFGAMGAKPTHPQLLDWLAVELVQNRWSIKHLQRLIVTSATYRQSSRHDEQRFNEDRQNLFLSRMTTRRMDAETLRDTMLSASGMLFEKRGGPGVRLVLSKDIAALLYKGTWEPTASEGEQARRTVYRFVKRNLRPNLMTAFDAPDTLVSCSQRTNSMHAGQALTLLNSPHTNQFAQTLAQRIAGDVQGEKTIAEQDWIRCISMAYRHILTREPTAIEVQLARQFFSKQLALMDESRDSDRAPNSKFRQVLADYCLVLFNLDEFLFY